MKTILFVYGTLKRGHRFHHLLSTSNFVGEATVKDWGLSAAYADVPTHPTAIAMACPRTGCEIEGELYEVGSVALAIIDRLERSYDRSEVKTKDGKLCHMYTGPIKEGPLWRRWPFDL